jgi:hypothetical protein
MGGESNLLPEWVGHVCFLLLSMDNLAVLLFLRVRSRDAQGASMSLQFMGVLAGAFSDAVLVAPYSFFLCSGTAALPVFG